MAARHAKLMLILHSNKNFYSYLRPCSRHEATIWYADEACEDILIDFVHSPEKSITNLTNESSISKENYRVDKKAKNKKN